MNARTHTYKQTHQTQATAETGGLCLGLFFAAHGPAAMRGGKEKAAKPLSSGSTKAEQLVRRSAAHSVCWSKHCKHATACTCAPTCNGRSHTQSVWGRRLCGRAQWPPAPPAAPAQAGWHWGNGIGGPFCDRRLCRQRHAQSCMSRRPALASTPTHPPYSEQGHAPVRRPSKQQAFDPCGQAPAPLLSSVCDAAQSMPSLLSSVRNAAQSMPGLLSSLCNASPSILSLLSSACNAAQSIFGLLSSVWDAAQSMPGVLQQACSHLCPNPKHVHTFTCYCNHHT